MEDTPSVRLALLEERMEQLMQKLETKEADFLRIEGKLNELLTLKNQGMGAIWLASLLLGSGLIAGITTFVTWIRT